MADILVGYDDSKCARSALDTAVELAQSLGDRVVLVYAYAPPPWNVGDEYAEHRRALREIGERITTGALERIGGRGVELEAELVAEKPVDALLRLAEARGARLIVVGTHGEGFLTGTILGSVPHKLLHRSQVPVLVVPAR
jgi:nucleotide-binding universal stress UspA family protein